MSLSPPPSAAAAADDDDTPTLSSHTLSALQEFLAEQNSSASNPAGAGADSDEVALVSEDWRMSQFWYDKTTAETVAAEVTRLCAATGSPVACVACPTLYAYLKKISPGVSAKLLEYDKRFEQYGDDFMFYDYNQPEELPASLRHAYRIIVADPPYLSKECLEKVAQTISFLACPERSYVLLLTGEVQTERAADMLKLHPCGFRPQHSNKLGNEFRLFTNYDPVDNLGGWARIEYDE